jgi:phosphoglycolate phosphatase
MKIMNVTNRYHHLIWDWNGTLFDDVQLCLDIMNGMLSKRGMPTVTREGYIQVFDFPVINYYRQLGYDFEQEPFEGISTEFITAYETQRAQCKLMPGTKATLEAIARLGLSQSVLSASKQDYLHQALREYGLAGYFSSAYGLDNHHAAGKQEAGLAFMAEQNLDPHKVLLVGDTTHDAQVAAAMGVDCWLIPNGHQDRGRLSAVGVPVIEDLTQVPAKLLPVGP